MFPQAKPPAIRDQHASETRSGDTVPAEQKSQAEASHVGASSKQIQAALRIRAALRAAHLDSTGAKALDGQPHEWTWIVKPPPRPPLVAAQSDGLNSEELLANDSLGG